MMAATEIDGKDSGLQKGDAAKIARIHRVSRQHVLEVARGNRPGRPALMETIRRYQQRAAETHQFQASA
jgi:hypothetical protein